jgi:uncharacterized Zn finger protein
MPKADSLQNTITYHLNRGDIHQQAPFNSNKKISQQFWGIAWQHHLQTLSDDPNRLRQGRTLQRKGLIYDLQFHPGKITATLVEDQLYPLTLFILPLSPEHQEQLQQTLHQQLSHTLNTLTQNLTTEQIQLLIHPETGLFPTAKELRCSCTCLDDHPICKHSSALLYSIGYQFDLNPNLLFQLRQYKLPPIQSLLQHSQLSIPQQQELSQIFGIDLTDT